MGTLLERMQEMPTQGVALPFRGFVRYRELNGVKLNGVRSHLIPIVLLHGIGSGSGSWLHQLSQTSLGHVLAWDAPGYADSSPLKMAEPAAADYAHVLWAWLDALQIKEVHLAGHSLGCIMAASAARLQPQRVKALTLLSPAQGYGTAPLEVREKKRDERLQAMAQLGLQKMAEQRAPRLLSPQADTEQIQLATHMMSCLNEGGYTQATYMLSTADIRSDLQAFKSASNAPIRVACGDQDVITPPAACQDLAKFIQAAYTDLPTAGHLCALQAPQAVSEIFKSSR
ncbi:MAG: alpha/beta fold hydrolase [Burkholderiales bacterium]|nr:MAG: alpha/beta fold hydrolase [Burkholderiales bacterium]